MVGGIVIGLARGADSTLVHVKDAKSVNSSGDECSVRVIERRCSDDSPVAIAVGDSLWWQCGRAMWTPKAVRDEGWRKHKCGVEYDIALPKVGYSH